MGHRFDKRQYLIRIKKWFYQTYFLQPYSVHLYTTGPLCRLCNRSANQMKSEGTSKAPRTFFIRSIRYINRTTWHCILSIVWRNVIKKFGRCKATMGRRNYKVQTSEERMRFASSHRRQTVRWSFTQYLLNKDSVSRCVERGCFHPQFKMGHRSLPTIGNDFTSFRSFWATSVWIL